MQPLSRFSLFFHLLLLFLPKLGVRVCVRMKFAARSDKAQTGRLKRATQPVKRNKVELKKEAKKRKGKNVGAHTRTRRALIFTTLGWSARELKKMTLSREPTDKWRSWLDTWPWLSLFGCDLGFFLSLSFFLSFRSTIYTCINIRVGKAGIRSN